MGIIYVLTCHITDEKYIGSTMRDLDTRYRRHKTDKSCVSRHIIERGNHSIKQLELFETDDRIELEKREQYWMNIIPNINHKRAFISKEQRIIDRKERWDKWYSNNKDELCKKRQNYYYSNYEQVRKGDRRRKDWRRSWKPDGRMGFYNDLLRISIDLFN